MGKTVLKVENLSKLYRLGVVGTGTLSHDLNRWWHLARGKEDPYKLVGTVNDTSSKSESDYVWALKNINFELKEGEVLGIIGKNGAGKSTLLKILSQITAPTSGRVKIKGRVASLLEVGTGFHPELTGRENIFLNGAILGMSRAEIQCKLDEIVAFSGVEKYVDTPVKRYSSGMKVRLGFAVAAHLEPEILIVDEVLAVGDYEFQKKCLGKMKDVSQEGRTVLFVSHNMQSVETLCERGIVLENSQKVFEGSQSEAVSFYLRNRNEDVCYSREWANDKRPGNQWVQVQSIIVSSGDKKKTHIDTLDDIYVSVKFEMRKSSTKRLDVALFVTDENGNYLFNLVTGENNPFTRGYSEGVYLVLFRIDKCLAEGIYNLSLRVIENQAMNPLFKLDDAITVEIKLSKNQRPRRIRWLINPSFEIKNFERVTA